MQELMELLKKLNDDDEVIIKQVTGILRLYLERRGRL